MSAAPSISPRAWAIGFPHSSESSSARISRSRSIRSAVFRRTRARVAAVSCGQEPLSKAVRAAAMAARASSARPSRHARHDDAVSGARALDRLAAAFDFAAADYHRAVTRKARKSCVELVRVDSDPRRSVHARYSYRPPKLGVRLARKAATPSAKIFRVCGERAGEALDRRVAVLAFGGVDHRLDHLNRERAALGDIGCERLARGQALALGDNFIDESERQAVLGRKHRARRAPCAARPRRRSGARAAACRTSPAPCRGRTRAGQA